MHEPEERRGGERRANKTTHRPVSYDQAPPEPVNEAVLSDLHPPRPLPVLIRATNAKGKEDREAKQKIKLSTIVEPPHSPLLRQIRRGVQARHGLVEAQGSEQTKG